MALISAPWPLYSRPSIQLGTLKAYLKAQFPTLKVQALHFYLKVAEGIGFRTYQAISERTWLAECLYGALLFPGRSRDIEKMFHREARGKAGLRGLDFQDLISQVKDVSEKLIDGVEWEHCGLAGVSICLCQLTSSLYFVKRIKQRAPDLPIVVGGSMFSGHATAGLLQAFPEVDFLVHGEGERPLSLLIQQMRNEGAGDDFSSIPGVVTRGLEATASPPAFCQMVDLADLPAPDYDDYFGLLKTVDPRKRFFPTLPAEISRGCWWRSTKGSSQQTGCAFCNLNLQWDGYRTKAASQVVSEVDHLTSKYKTLSVSFADNLMPLRHAKEIFLQLRDLGKDLRLFAEIRSTIPVKVLKTMETAGTHKVQIGIEALSTSLLKKLNKGTTAIQNMEVMKLCEELGISNTSNLILHFPGSDQQDVDETLRTLAFALPFRPLRFVHFWLGLGSPVWQDPRAFGLKAISNHPNYAVLFPPQICRSIQFMIQSYRGDRGFQKKLWQPVKKRVRAWNRAYRELHGGLSPSPILSYGDGRDFLIIRQRRLKAEPL
ncbi:MAG: RiPP maturation radical SAM C-methyltransferase, partial [Thermodesulfobacteriota bacterium]|nr:RiPP maturation radical SAM C-methyltransferase [Thermodesulfobacteriota bacterium]